MEDDIEKVDNFDSDEQSHNEENLENILEYNLNEYQFEIIYNKMVQMHILKKDFICEICGKTMFMETITQLWIKKYLDAEETVQNMIEK